jgi:hypothetical protein
MHELKLDVVIERKHAEMAAFVVVPAPKVAAWKLAATTTVEGTLDGVELGRRSLQRWDEKRWFLELRKDHLDAIGKSPGDRAKLVLRRASVGLPAELQALIDSNPAARARWNAHTDAQRRMMREEILGAKTSATRERRARRALLPAVQPKPPRVEGLRQESRAIVVRIIARDLPGRTCGPYSDVSVGLAQKVGCDPTDRVHADAREARWETTIDVRESDGVPAFRGPAVNGPPRERFLYLTWIGRKGGAAPAMFRRAKLRLDSVPADVLAASLESGVLIGRVGLTAPDGMPLCASVRPPAIIWKST